MLIVINELQVSSHVNSCNSGDKCNRLIKKPFVAVLVHGWDGTADGVQSDRMERVEVCETLEAVAEG